MGRGTRDVGRGTHGVSSREESAHPASRIPRPAPRAPRPASRITRSRTAPPTREVCPSSPAMTNAAPDSRASLVRRTATPRDSTGPESITTSANAPHRNSTSAHHAARDGSRGRIIHSPSPPRCAQSRGASVRVASMYATQPASLSVRATIWRSSVTLPLPRAPTTSVNRPRGNPPPTSRASSASTPVGSVRPSAPAGAERGWGRRSTRDCGSIGVWSGFTPATAETAATRRGE